MSGHAAAAAADADELGQSCVCVCYFFFRAHCCRWLFVREIMDFDVLLLLR